MVNNKVQYKEVAKANISDRKNLVISECSKGGYTIAQQLMATDGNAEVAIFLKGAIHVEDISALERVRDAINIVLASIADDNDEAWDE